MIGSSLKTTPTGMQGSILARLEKDRGENTLPATKKSWLKLHWRWRLALLGVALAAILVWWLHQRWRETRFEWGAFAASFLQLDWRWLLATAALTVLTYYGRALRWGVMLRPLEPKINHWRLFKATAIGFSAVVLLGRPGEFVRPYLISIRERVSFSSQLAAWFIERLCDLLAVLVIFGFALTQFDPARAHVGPKLQWVFEVGGSMLAVMGGISIVILVMLGRFSDTARRRLLDGLGFLPEHHHRRAERFITAFLDGTSSTKTHSSVLWLISYTAFEWAVIVLTFICLFKAYPATAGFALRDVMVFMGFVVFGSVIQIPGVGGGLQIVSIIVLTEIFGLGVELATSIALMIWVFTFIVIVPIGLAFAFHEGLNWKRLRQLEADAVANAEEDETAGGTLA